MAKVTLVKKAQKDYPEHNIQKGESYYWWQLFRRPKQFSKTPPTRSQLTQSSFLQSLFAIEDRISALSGYFNFIEELESEMEEIKSEIESLKEEVEGNLTNMPEHLRESSDSGILMQERIDGLEGWINDLDSIDYSFEVDDSQTIEKQEEELSNCISNIIDEIQQTSSGL